MVAAQSVLTICPASVASDSWSNCQSTCRTGTKGPIPRTARGAEALFDTFATLQGLDIAQLLRRIEAAPSLADQLIWQRDARILLT